MELVVSLIFVKLGGFNFVSLILYGQIGGFNLIFVKLGGFNSVTI